MASAAPLVRAGAVITPRHFLWRWFARVVSLLFRVAPEQVRFRLVLALVRVLPRSIGRFLARRAGRTELLLPRDEVARVIFRALMDGGTSFTPRVEFEESGELPAGALLVAPHYPLNALIVSHLMQRGHDVVAVKAFPQFDRRVWGGERMYEVLEAGPGTLLRIQRRVASGHLVLVHADTGSAESGGLPIIGTGVAPLHTEPKLFELARRFRIPLFFAAVRLNEDGSPALTLRAVGGEAEFATFAVDHWTAGAR